MSARATFWCSTISGGEAWRTGRLYLVVVFVAFTFGAAGNLVGGEPYIAAPLASPVPVAAPFAVSGTARKSLPPLDCLRCFGPAPGKPCHAHHPGFLYFATYPWDDDPANALHQCIDGNCGRGAEGLARAWMRLLGPEMHTARRTRGTWDGTRGGTPCRDR